MNFLKWFFNRLFEMFGLASVESMITPDEQLIKMFKFVKCNMIAGNAPKNAWGQEVKTDNQPGTFVITSKRIFFKKAIKGDLLQINSNMISSVEKKDGITSSEITINSTSGQKLVVMGMAKGKALEILNAVNSLIGNNSSTTSNVTVQKAESIPDQIKKLSDLKNQGILTEDEFNKKKNELLNKM